MSENPGQNVPVYFAPDETDFLDRFDRVADKYQDKRRYSRSEAIREAMELYVEVLELMDNADLDVADMSPHSRRMTVRQALLDQSRQ